MMDKTPQNGPLAGIRILDLTKLYPGPLATMMLAEMGADVIKIEDPAAPDPMRFYPPYIADQSAGFLAVNRSKRSLALNLKTPAGRDIFFKLAAGADIVIEQFRPGVVDAMGIGYERAKEVHPGIIYVSLTGYGQDGPYSRQAGHDINYIGYSGILAATGTALSGPVVPGPQLADVAGGAYMTIIACLSAVWAREKSGRGQRVDVAMLDGVLPLMTLQMAHSLATQTSFAPQDAPLSGGLAHYGVYECSDGNFIALGILEEKFWKHFCNWVNRPDWTDQLFALGEEGEKLRVALAGLFKTRSRDDWTKAAAGLDVCLTPVCGIGELQHDPHLSARGMIIKQSHPLCGNISGIGMPLKFSETPGPAARPAPALGQDTLSLLSEIGFQPDEIAALQEEGVILLA
jgi:crotonobetainyl-CoA:carnitine CoA-transferase CaiB-like acyl-CoA transferase